MSPNGDSSEGLWRSSSFVREGRFCRNTGDDQETVLWLVEAREFFEILNRLPAQPSVRAFVGVFGVHMQQGLCGGWWWNAMEYNLRFSVDCSNNLASSGTAPTSCGGACLTPSSGCCVDRYE